MPLEGNYQSFQPKESLFFHTSWWQFITFYPQATVYFLLARSIRAGASVWAGPTEISHCSANSSEEECPDVRAGGRLEAPVWVGRVCAQRGWRTGLGCPVTWPQAEGHLDVWSINHQVIFSFCSVDFSRLFTHKNVSNSQTLVWKWVKNLHSIHLIPKWICGLSEGRHQEQLSDI